MEELILANLESDNPMPHIDRTPQIDSDASDSFELDFLLTLIAKIMLDQDRSKEAKQEEPKNGERTSETTS